MHQAVLMINLFFETLLLKLYTIVWMGGYDLPWCGVYRDQEIILLNSFLPANFVDCVSSQNPAQVARLLRKEPFLTHWAISTSSEGVWLFQITEYLA